MLYNPYRRKRAATFFSMLLSIRSTMSLINRITSGKRQLLNLCGQGKIYLQVVLLKKVDTDANDVTLTKTD